MRPRITGLAAAVVLAAGLFTSTGTATAAPIGVGLPTIVDAAKDKAALKYPQARFFGAEAELDQPPVSGVEGIEGWAVNFSDPSHPSGGFSYIYDIRGEYVETVIWQPGVGIEAVEPFTMIEDKALAALRGSGVTEPFSELYLAQPVVPDSEPIYYFCVVRGDEGQVTGVGTRSLEVFPDLFGCAP
ncbi:hypothetical protein ABZ816_23205 [Actinosynnema sp. NPDC047251]|uniref:Putative secreted protein n=1 Tax=Saccharothrix espanaensis (strain ATCC 51144 / DSM 44229 / JCM 9112 / NBRC 15066 / NRRL 15764) TaxID=1179773 RepID=K0JZS3_SACES|nr:hypothetical protein [Saccharothrix espanaensis]CCH33490.1 putative secreted protein [Saccharothrix espanaensis DSM 44229]